MLQKLGFLPGFNKQVTSTGAESQWTGGENVRFRYGTPEKIGGWNQLGESKLTGVARGLHHFVNKESTKFAAIGTNRILYVYSGGVYYDIHPLTNPSGTAITNAFSTSNNDAAVTITFGSSHNFQAEDGIRDFCLSRGLGDVYKRQMLCKVISTMDNDGVGNLLYTLNII